MEILRVLITLIFVALPLTAVILVTFNAYRKFRAEKNNRPDKDAEHRDDPQL